MPVRAARSFAPLSRIIFRESRLLINVQICRRFIFSFCAVKHARAARRKGSAGRSRPRIPRALSPAPFFRFPAQRAFPSSARANSLVRGNAVDREIVSSGSLGTRSRSASRADTRADRSPVGTRLETDFIGYRSIGIKTELVGGIFERFFGGERYRSPRAARHSSRSRPGAPLGKRDECAGCSRIA